jgi:hypothetical protein
MSRIGQFEKFVRQYLNETGGGSSAAFQRKFFKPIAWQNDMRTLSGYIVTDTAISDDESACYSVIAYVGLDASDNIYLLDLMVGNPDHHEFGNWFFQMLEEWTPRVNHCGECWESAVLSMAYRNYIIRDSRVRKFRLHTLEMKRPPQSQKEGRINRLQPVMKSGDFYVVDTVPKTFTDSTGEKVLWDPTGFYDARTRVHLPAGELVDEFIRKGGKKDIPDAIAMVLEHEKTRTGYRRMCRYKPYRPPDPVASLTEQRDEAYHREQYGSASQEDWWEKTLRENDL